MRIGIDARMFGPRQGGLGRYVQQLVLHLEKLNTNDEFVIFLRQENWDEYEPKNPHFKKVLANIPWYGWREQILLPQILNKEKIDLMHFPHWNVPLFYSKPFVVTIHDLLLLHYPTREASTLGPIGYFFKQLIFKIVLNHAARQAKKIITVSEFSKNDIVKTLNIPANKISVTYPAPLPKSYNENLKEKKEEIFTKFGITKPFVLYVGVAYPHKNLNRLLEAWKIFQEKYNVNYQLVLAGKEDFFYNKLKNNFANENNVIFAGFINDNELQTLYINAALYVFPSLYEGFGLPPLEAMQYNIPVISSDRTCLPEILKNAAIYFNPENITEMAEAIQRGLTDQTLRSELVANGQKLYPAYSWKILAEKTLQTYAD